MALGRVADTSWLNAIFDLDDAHSAAARTELVAPRPTLVPAAIMVETLDLLRYRLGKDAAVAAHAAMVRFPHFDPWYPVHEQEAVRQWRAHPKLSLNDAHAVALARSTGFELASFDQAQIDAAGQADPAKGKPAAGKPGKDKAGKGPRRAERATQP